MQDEATATFADPRIPTRETCVLRYALERFAREKPDETYVVFGNGESWSYRETPGAHRRARRGAAVAGRETGRPRRRMAAERRGGAAQPLRGQLSRRRLRAHQHRLSRFDPRTCGGEHGRRTHDRAWRSGAPARRDRPGAVEASRYLRSGRRGASRSRRRTVRNAAGPAARPARTGRSIRGTRRPSSTRRARRGPPRASSCPISTCFPMPGRRHGTS